MAALADYEIGIAPATDEELISHGSDECPAPEMSPEENLVRALTDAIEQFERDNLIGKFAACGFILSTTSSCCGCKEYSVPRNEAWPSS